MSWPLVTIDSIKSIEKYSLVGGPFGSNLSGKHYVEDGVPVIRGGNLPDHRKFLFEDFVWVSEEKADSLIQNMAYPGDVIFTQRGTLGQVGIVSKDSGYKRFVVSQSQMKLTVNDEIVLAEYVYYVFSSESYKSAIKSHSITSGVPHINLGILKKMLIPLPPKKVQEHIVDTLNAYDDLIENNRRRIQLLEESARLLYKEWFVHLRFPGHEHAKITDGVPDGWELKKLVDIAVLTMGQSPKSEFYNEIGEGLPFHQGVTNYGFRFVAHKTYCTTITRLAEPGDILCSVRAPVGRLNITLDKMVLGRGLAAIRAKSGHQSFLFYSLRAFFFKEDIMGSGAIYASVTKKDMEGIELLIPSSMMLQEFEDQASEIDLQIINLSKQNYQLAQARDILLPRLMKGELTV